MLDNEEENILWIRLESIYMYVPISKVVHEHIIS